MRDSRGVDIVCVQELGTLDPVLFRSLREMRGFQYARIWYCARPGGRGGGVAFIALNPKLDIQVVGRISRGGLTIRVRAPGFEPFALTNCYFPPAGSAHYEDAAFLHAWLPHEQARLVGTMDIRDHLFAADWNDRQGCEGRVTPDSRRASARITALQRALDASPALGRSDGVMAATFPSRGLKSDRRAPREQSEIDGFWCGRALACHRLGGLHPDYRPSWRDFFCADGHRNGPRLPGDLTHLPVFLDFQPVLSGAPARPQSRLRMRQRDSYTPVYVDRSWADRARANEVRLARVGAMALDPQTPLEITHAAIRDGTLAAARDVHPRTAHAPTAAYRLFNNTAMPTPAAFVNDSDEARKLAARGKRLRQRGRLAIGISDAERLRVEAEGSELLRQAEILQTRANTLAAGVARRWRAQLSHAIDRTRRIDLHNLSQLVLSELTLADPLLSEPDDSIPQAPGQPAPLEHFYGFFRRITSEWRLGRAHGVAGARTFWSRLIPVAPEDASLTAQVSPALIYCILFPLSKRFPPPRCSDGACPACDRLHAAWHAWNPDDPYSTSPQPSFKPSLRASRAAGPDGVRCEDWRWARPANLDERFDYRWRMATQLAGYVNRILAEGRVPAEEFADCISTPIFKEAKPGQPKPDASRPNNYRHITVGQLLAKLVSLVLTFRLTHWALRHGMISPEQVAFMPYHSAESHVFVLTQLLRSRARMGLSTRVLFIDLVKAYNRVHLASLWCLLRQMGVPAIIVALLDDWAAKRRTRLRVNGELSPEYSMLAGTPQGDPLSCLLFNLYIEPLIRYINSLETIRGVPIPGSNRIVKSLFFADDIGGISAPEVDDLQFTMDAVMHWCHDWHMEVGVDKGKTETCTFPGYPSAEVMLPAVYANPYHAPDGAAAAPGSAATGVASESECVVSPAAWKVELAAAAEAAADPGHLQAAMALPVSCAINESDSYRYLGLRVHADLTDRLATKHLIKTMDRLYYRYFVHNLTIRRCSPTLQLQLLHSNIFGPIVYLLSILNVSSETRAQFDRRARRFGRHVFGLPRDAPNSIVTGLTRFNSFDALQGRERARLFMQLSDPLLPSSIANDVLRGVLLENSGRRLADANMPARHVANLARLEQLGVAAPPVNAAPHRVAIEAGLYGDRIALQQWQHEARVASGVADPPRGDRPRRGSEAALLHRQAALRLPRPLPLEHAADIYFNFSQPIGVGPLKHGLVPLSYLGAGGTSIPALSNRQHQPVAVVARLHTGSTALRRYPWRSRNPRRARARAGSGVAGADDELSDDDTVASDSSDSDSDAEEEGCSDTDSAYPSSVSVALPERPRPVHASSASPPSVRIASGLIAPRPSGHAPLPRPDLPRAAALPCRFCSRGHEHPAHVFFECTAGRLPELRVLLFADARLAWGRVLSRIEEAVLQEYRDEIPEVPQARAAVDAAFSAAEQSEAQWLTHRLLWAVPWPAAVVPADAAAARTIGIIFDQTTLSRHASRPLADTWITWASRWTQEFGARWAELLQAGDDDQVESDATLSDSEPSAGPGSDPLAPPEPECRTLDSSSPRTDPLLPSSQSDQSSEA